MSPASYLTAPPRVAGASIASRKSRARAGYDRVMPFVIVSAVVSVLAFGAAAAFAVVRGLALWRGFRSFSGQLGEALDHVSQAGERASEKASTLGDGNEALTPSLERLATSRAQLSVVLAAVSDVRASLGGVTGVMPKK